MVFLADLLSNRFVTVPALAWFLAQAFKLISTLIKYKRLDWTRLVGTGGMPSSHAAYVTSLCVAVAKNVGVDTAAFGISFAFALVVISDAAGVRRAAGKQAKLLNKLMSTHFPGDDFNERLKELIGHQPIEVFIGSILGILLGLFLS